MSFDTVAMTEIFIYTHSLWNWGSGQKVKKKNRDLF
jgi:hypothetical protein